MIVGNRVKRAVLGTGATLTLLTGLIGFMHTPAGRPMLRWLAGSVGCPVGGHLEPAERDAAMLQARQVFKGEVPAASRQALVFTLGETTRETVRTLAADKGIACKDEEFARLHCTDVPAAALGVEMPVADLVVSFDAKDRLQGIDVHTGSLAADEAARLVEERSEAISKQAGPPTSTAGVATGEWLSSGPLAQVSESFHYSDRRAELTATNFGDGRIVLREFHQTL
jgi:hypothetical protein